MKKTNLLFLALIFLLVHVTKVFAQIDKYKHYYTTKEVGSYFVSENDLFWENTIGIFKKNLKTQKIELIRQNNAKISQRSVFKGIDDEGKWWIQSSTIPKYMVHDGKSFLPNDTLTQHQVKVPLKNLKFFLINSDKKKWLADSVGKLFIFSKTEVQIFKNTGINEIQNISSVSIDFKQNLWLTTYKEIYKFDKQTGKLLKIDTEGLFNELGSRINIISHGVDQNENIWVGIIPKSAIGFYNNKTGKWSKIRFDENPHFTGVRGIAIDKDDTKWFTSSNGILKYDNKDWAFFYNDETSNSSYQISLDKENNAYVGYILGTIYKFENNQFKRVIESDNPLESNTISSIFCDNNLLWINASKGLHNFDGKNWVSFDLEQVGNPNFKFVNDFSVSEDGSRWFGTTTGLLKLKENKWEIFDRNNNGLSNDQVNSFIVDSEKNLWIGTREGLFKYNQSFASTKILLNPNQTYGEYINFIKKDKDGFIWVGKGEYIPTIYKYNANNTKFESKNQSVIQAINDSKNNLFFLTSKSLLTTSDGEICIPDFKLPSFKNINFYKMFFEGDTLWILLGNGNIIKSSNKSFEVFKNPIIDMLKEGITCFCVCRSKIYIGSQNGLFELNPTDLEKIKLFTNW
jgi:ligand-binding sensor domain-containing protein